MNAELPTTPHTEFPTRPYIGRAVVPPSPAVDARFVLLPPYVHGRPAVSHAEPELPSIDEFLDHAPPIEQFAPTGGADDPREGDWPSWGGEAGSASSAPQADEWVRSEWQGFDWGSAARLGIPRPDAAAAAAWAGTDWNEPRGTQQSRQSAAEALARALDQIARRIRAGELRIPGPENVQDDAAIATTLATLLGIRR